MVQISSTNRPRTTERTPALRRCLSAALPWQVWLSYTSRQRQTTASCTPGGRGRKLGTHLDTLLTCTASSVARACCPGFVNEKNFNHELTQDPQVPAIVEIFGPHDRIEINSSKKFSSEAWCVHIQT